MFCMRISSCLVEWFGVCCGMSSDDEREVQSLIQPAVQEEPPLPFDKAAWRQSIAEWDETSCKARGVSQSLGLSSSSNHPEEGYPFEGFSGQERTSGTCFQAPTDLNTVALDHRSVGSLEERTSQEEQESRE